jgi:hypothetical protein
VIRDVGRKCRLRLTEKELLRNYSAISTPKLEPLECLTLSARSSLYHRPAILDLRICPTFSNASRMAETAGLQMSECRR